jgi:hypothetical protein
MSGLSCTNFPIDSDSKIIDVCRHDPLHPYCCTGKRKHRCTVKKIIVTNASPMLTAKVKFCKRMHCGAIKGGNLVSSAFAYVIYVTNVYNESYMQKKYILLYFVYIIKLWPESLYQWPNCII